jgi:hypothetical protein
MRFWAACEAYKTLDANKRDRLTYLHKKLSVLSQNQYLFFSLFTGSRVHCKKLTKLSLAGNILITPGQGEFG